MSHPIPPVEKSKYYTDPRIDQVQAGIESIDIVSPTYRADMNKFHEFRSRAIEEEVRTRTTGHRERARARGWR